MYMTSGVWSKTYILLYWIDMNNLKSPIIIKATQTKQQQKHIENIKGIRYSKKHKHNKKTQIDNKIKAKQTNPNDPMIIMVIH